MRYIPQLDSLRAIAVLLVMISHWIPEKLLLNRLPNGRLGVDIFFVLSGFLISWILIVNKRKANAGTGGMRSVFTSFYIRRSLRIFPVYYLVLILLLIFHNATNTSIASSYPYYFTYTSNFYMFSLGGWDGIISHFWSLAVEEQFYLVWPSVILLIPERFLLKGILATIIVGIISEYSLLEFPYGLILTHACLHSFAFGALLAWFVTTNEQKLDWFYRLLKVPAVIAILYMITGLFYGEIYLFMFRTFSSLLALFIVTFIVVKSKTGKLDKHWFWSNGILIFLGKISYGLYIYHNLIPYFTYGFLERQGITVSDWLPFKMGYPVVTIVNFLLTIIVSYVSWKIVEQPLLRLKQKFSYVNASGNAHTPAN
ncbi:MAG: acyltransferase [Chitinophagaceae bacterium]